MKKQNQVIPPFRYGTVEENLYRGGYLKERNLEFMKRLGLKSIVSLVPDQPKDYLLDFCNNQGIKNFFIKVEKPKDSLPLTTSKVLGILQILINPQNHPLYLHCLDGSMITGVVIICLRKLQTWSIPIAILEYLRYIRDGVIGAEESEFIEKFCPEIDILFDTLPKWLWNGKISFKKHPTFKLRNINPTLLDASILEKNDKSEYKKIVEDLLIPNVKVNNTEIKAETGTETETETEMMSMTVRALALEGESTEK